MIFFTSDQHYGHENIIKHCMRPFSSAHEMNCVMTERHNSVVSSGDTVIHLGDVVWGPTRVESIIPRLNGHHILVPGNHDSVHPLHKKRNRMIQLYEDAGVKIIDVDTIMEFPGIGNVRLCHFPYNGDHSLVVDRYTEWRPKQGDERFLVHGHVHERWKVKGREINVGVDQWNFTPVSIDTIIALMQEIDE